MSDSKELHLRLVKKVNGRFSESDFAIVLPPDKTLTPEQIFRYYEQAERMLAFRDQCNALSIEGQQ